MKVPGPTSFDDLKKTYDPSRNPAHIIHDTFQDACRDLGLIQDDQEWITCMRSSASFASAYQMRQLFVSLLLFNSISNPLELWNSFKEQMSADFFYQARLTNRERMYDEGILNQSLRSIRLSLQSYGRDLNDFQLPIPPDMLPGEGNVLVDEERGKYDLRLQAQIHDTNVLLLNEHQQLAYNMIMDSVKTIKAFNDILNDGINAIYPNVQNCYFIDG